MIETLNTNKQLELQQEKEKGERMLIFQRNKGGRRPGPEVAWRAAVVEYLRIKYPQAWILPIRGGLGQRVGVPDLLVVINGRLLGIELKDPARPRPLSPKQLSEAEAIRRAGGIAGRVASWEELEALLEEVLREASWEELEDEQCNKKH